MKEYQIVVFRSYDNSLFYTARVRNVHFLWRGFWKNIRTAMVPTMEEAEELIRQHVKITKP